MPRSSLLARHLVAVSLVVLCGLAVAVLQVADSHVVVPAAAATASIALFVVLYLSVGAALVHRHLSTGAERPLGLGLAYVLAGGLAAAQALRHGNPAAWTWVGWHIAFPSSFALSMVLSTAAGPRRPRRALAYVAGALTAAAAFVALAEVFPHVLRPGSSVDLKALAGAEVLAVNLVAMIAVVLRARRSSPLERWLIVAAGAASTDVVLTLAAGGATDSVGWWVGRALGVLAASVALVALVREARRPQPRALVLLVLDGVVGDAARAAAERLRGALRGDDRLEQQPDGAFLLVLTGVEGAEASLALARLGTALAGEDLVVRGGWAALSPGEEPAGDALARAQAVLRMLPRPPARIAGEPLLGAA